MPWLKHKNLIPTKPVHNCQVPYKKGFLSWPDGEIGDIWQCKDCKTVWEIRGMYGDASPVWSRVTGKRAQKLIRKYAIKE